MCASACPASTLSMKAVRRLLEGDMKLQALELDKHKGLVTRLLDEVRSPAWVRMHQQAAKTKEQVEI